MKKALLDENFFKVMDIIKPISGITELDNDDEKIEFVKSNILNVNKQIHDFSISEADRNIYFRFELLMLYLNNIADYIFYMSKRKITQSDFENAKSKLESLLSSAKDFNKNYPWWKKIFSSHIKSKNIEYITDISNLITSELEILSNTDKSLCGVLGNIKYTIKEGIGNLLKAYINTEYDIFSKEFYYNRFKKIIFVIDMQNGFANAYDGNLEGGLPVNGAREMAILLNKYIKFNNHLAIYSGDFHPSDHCSFKENGGEWPQHCHTEWEQAIMSELDVFSKSTSIILKKAIDKNVDEYSCFKNAKNIQKVFNLFIENNIIEKTKSAEKPYILTENICIEFVGLVLEYCVEASIKDFIEIFNKNVDTKNYAFSISINEEYVISLKENATSEIQDIIKKYSIIR